MDGFIVNLNEKSNKSLKKLPKYIVVESEYFKINGMSDETSLIRPKLITLSNSKQTGIIKNVIW